MLLFKVELSTSCIVAAVLKVQIFFGSMSAAITIQM